MAIVGFILSNLFSFFVDFIIKIFNRFSKAGWYFFGLKYYGIFVVAMTAFLSSLFSLLVQIYKFIIYFFDLLNGYIANTGSEVVNVGFSVLKSVGFFEALSDASAIFLPIVFTFVFLTGLRASAYISYERINLLHKMTSNLTDGDNKKGKNRFSKGKK